ncbi:MAG: hypothetical protein LBU60_04540 [Clostridiales bacterium]|jgi:hypothetical protein|nr:hypothetical protein [Clostridiales bacterium]
MTDMNTLKQELAKSQKFRSIRTKLTIFILALILPISAVMIAMLNTNHGAKPTSPPFAQQDNFWRDSSNENTRFGLDELQNKFADLNAVSRTSTSQEEFEQSMWKMLVEMQGQYNQDMWRELNNDNAADFVNYQTEELRSSVDSSYIDTVKQGLANDGEDSSYFFDNYLNGETKQFAPDTNQRIALVAVPGLASGAWTTMNVALNTAYYTVKAAGWWVPAFITAGIVLVALAVVTAVVVMYWDVIRPVFNNIVNQFLSIAGKVVSWVRGFFDGVLGNAQTALTKVIAGVRYVIDVALTTAVVSQIQKSGQYFLVLRHNGKMYFYPISVSQSMAANALMMNQENLGTYTINQMDAVFVAQKASINGTINQYDGKAFEVHGTSSSNNIYFWHCHPFGRNNAHSWYGSPWYGGPSRA